MGFLFLASLNILFKWFIFEKLIILEEWRLTFKKSCELTLSSGGSHLCAGLNLDKSKWLQQIPQTLFKQTFLFVEGMPKPHMVKNSVHNFGVFAVGRAVLLAVSPVHSVYSLCVFTHSQSSSLKHTHFHCQTQIFTLSYTQTPSHRLPWFNRQRVLQSINLLWRTRSRGRRRQSQNQITHALPTCSGLKSIQGPLYTQQACDLKTSPCAAREGGERNNRRNS